VKFSSNKIGLMQGRLSPVIKKRIQSFPSKTWVREFNYLKKANLRLMEWTLDYEEIRQNPIFDKKKINLIKYLKKKNQVIVESLTADFFMQKPFWKYKKKNMILKNLFIDVINAVRNIGIKIIVVPLVDNSKIQNIHEMKQVIIFFKEITSILKKNNQIVAFETDLSPKQNLIFIKKFNPKYFGINYDIGNSASKNFKCEEEIKLYGNYIKNIHIKDRIIFGKTVRLGYGNVNFEKFFRALKKKKYKGNFVMQTARSKNNKHFNEVKINLNFLKKWFI
jgi:hexulose-6-phosphate isomerase